MERQEYITVSETISADDGVDYVIVAEDAPFEHRDLITDPDAGLMTDKRRHKRVTMAQVIECEVGGKIFKFRSADISPDGMFIESVGAFPCGTIITVRFSLPNSEEVIAATARVCYVQKSIGFGVKFHEIRPEDAQRIAALVEASPVQKFGNPLSNEAAMTVKIPVRLEGVEKSGAAFSELATLTKLSKNGVCVVTGRDITTGASLIMYVLNGTRFTGRVLWVGNRMTRTDGQVIIRCRGMAQSLGFYFP